jgi:hypothetical protein
LFLSLSVVEGNSPIIVSCWRQEDEASVFDVVHGEGQSLTLGIVVNVNSREELGGDFPT